MSRNRKTFWGVLLAFLLVGATVAVFLMRFDTYHLATVRDGVLYRDGNRGMREFRTSLRKVQPRTVVMLVTDAEIALPTKPQFQQEVDYLKRQGIPLVRIPIPQSTPPTTDNVRTFLEIVEDRANQPVLVHCAQGMVRTGMMVAAYQESVLGWDDAKARQELLTFGRTGDSLRIVQQFIDRYDGKSRTVREPDASSAAATTCPLPPGAGEVD